MRLKLSALLAVLLSFSASASADSLTPLGGLFGGVFSEANGVSADGSVVVGRSNSASGQEAFRWTSDGGMVGLGDLPGGNFISVASGVSADGSVVVGRGITTSFLEAFRWTSGGGMVGLGTLPRWTGSAAADVSADGSVVVGSSLESDFHGQAFRWTSGGGMVGLGTLPGRSASYANDVSADGSIVVGYSSDSILDSGSQAFRWTSGGGMVGLGTLPGQSGSWAGAISADGFVVVGVSGSQAFRWTSNGGMVGLGDLPGGSSWPAARGVSADGSVVVGLTTNSFFGPGAFYWTADGGMRALWDVLLSHGVDPAADGWTKLSSAYGVSADGNTIVGYGIRNNNNEAFVAVVPEPSVLGLFGLAVPALFRRRHQSRQRQAIRRACCEVLEARQLLSFSPATSFPVGTDPQAVVTADFNNDGKLDLATSGHDEATGDSSVSVLLGNGNGGFQPAPSSATGPYPLSLAAGDFNADGKLDLATANRDGYFNNDAVSILLGHGDGTFAAPVGLYAYGEAPNSVAAGDMNADGKLDLVVASGTLYGYVSVLLGHGDGTFAAAVPSDEYVGPFYSPVLADFNGDGKLDVATTRGESDFVDVFLGNGDGTLQEPRGFAVGTGGIYDGPYSLAAGDFNADGKLDLATANTASNSVSMLLGKGDGNFQTAQSFAAGNAPQSATASDVNGDGKFDLVVANPLSTSSPGAVSVLLGNGTGSLAQPMTTPTSATGGSPSSVVVADFNGDGRPDAAAANTVSNNVSVLLNDGNWGTVPPPPPPTVSISDVSRAEGNSGTTPFTFTVSLSSASGLAVQVNYTTASGSATSSGGNRDYQSISGTLNFPAGVTSQTVTVSVFGDTRNEPDETFFVSLSQPTNATIADPQGVGTILNDDGGRGKSWSGAASGGNWSTSSNWSPIGVPTSDSLVRISGAIVNLTSSASISELSLNSGAALKLAASGDRALRTAGLFLDPDSGLDLSDNELIIDYIGDSPAPAVRELLLRGRNGGAWNGIGLTSSAAVVGATGLGYAEAVDLFSSFPASLGAQSVDSTSIIVRHTLLGDANLDRKVDVADLGVLASNWQVMDKAFSQGDFDYSGTVDVNDLGLLASNWQKSLPQPSTQQVIPTTPSNARRRSMDRVIDEIV